MKKVLITGSSGFIGGHLVEAALNYGLEVYAAVRKQSSLEYLNDPRINILLVDFNDQAAIGNMLSEHKFDFVIHNAGATKAPARETFDLVNYGITKRLADALIERDVVPEKFVLISSLAALGPGDAKTLDSIVYSDKPNPITAYGRSKLKAENYLGSLNSFPFVVVRPTAVYGPREKEIFTFFKLINYGLEPLIGFRDQYLSFIYAKDLAEIVLRSIEKGKPGKAYLAAHEEVTSMENLATTAKKILNKKTLKVHVPMFLLKGVAGVSELVQKLTGRYAAFNQEKVKELSSINWKCDIKLVKDELDYTPTTNLDEGLNHTLNWYKEEKWL